MLQIIKSADDLRWLIGHTGGFRGGYVTDVHMAKRRLLDEATGRDVLADTTVTVVIRYQIRGIVRVAQLTMRGVTDFSIFEQEGADCSSLSLIQAEATAGRFRFWFDPQGELYVVCEEAELEEISTPLSTPVSVSIPAQWVFQASAGRGPTIAWLLKQLDQAGVPCAWRASKTMKKARRTLRFQGDVAPDAGKAQAKSRCLHVQAYGPCEGAAFRIVLQTAQGRDGRAGRLLAILADAIARTYTGTCLVGNTMIPASEWAIWKIEEAKRLERVADLEKSAP